MLGSGVAPAATPTFASATSGASTASAQTLTVPVPTVTAGDVLVAAVAFRLASGAAVSTPQGWTDVVRTSCTTNASPLSQAIFVRSATQAEPTELTFTLSSSTGAVASVLAYQGVDGAQPVAASAGAITRNTRGIGTSITTTIPGTRLVGAFAHSGTSAITPPGGMSTRTSPVTGTGAPSARGLTADEQLASAGTYQRSATAAARNTCNVAQLIALRPAPDAPANTALPVISGQALENEVLTASAGSWSGAPTSHAFAWQRCASDGGSCSAIPGATASSHQLAGGDVGSTLRVVVTATNSGGSTSATSGPSEVVAPASPPANVALPTISGDAREGEVLTASDGSWSGSPASLDREWQRCDGSGGSCLPIAGAFATTHALSNADVGFTIRVLVTATNSAGSTSAVSSATAVVLPAPPASAGAPSVTGAPRVGETLVATTGTWTGDPTSFAFQWERCDTSALACVVVAGATSAEFVVTVTDIGSRMRVTVSATNAGGTGTSSSDATAVVLPEPPGNLALPTVSGTPRQSEPLTADPGSWSNAPTGYAYQWQRSADLVTWDNVSDASAEYVPDDADVGSLLRVLVTASNAGGSATAASGPVGPIAPPVSPESLAAPTISGTAQEGSELTATTGVWSGTPTDYAYQWERCEADGVTCSPVVGASSSTYTPDASDIGSPLRVVVSATNPGGTGSAASEPTVPVLRAAPTNTAPPVLSGTALEGLDLTTTLGEWTGEPSAYTYLWHRCAPDGAGCVPVTWADGPTYRLRDADVGLTIRAFVTATNEGGATSAMSEPTDVVVPLPPANEAPPSISGIFEIGETISASPGTWRSAAAIVLTYAWERSADGGASWSAIAGAQGSGYQTTGDDFGAILRAVVTATNVGGSSSATSAPTEPIADPGRPVSTGMPTFSGYVQSGRTLDAAVGTWSGSPTSFAYQWQLSGDAGQTWADIAGATSSGYALKASEIASEIRVVVTATNAFGSSTAASPSTAVHPATGVVVLANTPWRCTTSVNLDLVKVMQWTRDADAVVLAVGCTGRIGRVEVLTNTQDAIKTQNASSNAAHDLVIESGWAQCPARSPGAHQDGWQNMGGARITIRNFVWNCGDMNDAYGSGVAQGVVIGRAGSNVTTPTDIVVEHSVIMSGAAHTFALFEPSLRSGARNSVLCPDRTPGDGVFEADAVALEIVNSGNEVAELADPRCSTFSAALAWAQGTP